MGNKLQPGGPCCLTCDRYKNLPDAFDITVDLTLGALPDHTAFCNTEELPATACDPQNLQPEWADALPRQCSSIQPETSYTCRLVFDEIRNLIGGDQAIYRLEAEPGKFALLIEDPPEGFGNINIGDQVSHHGLPIGTHEINTRSVCLDNNLCGGDGSLDGIIFPMVGYKFELLNKGFTSATAIVDCSTGSIDFTANLQRWIRYSLSLPISSFPTASCDSFPTSFPAYSEVWEDAGTQYRVGAQATLSDLSAVGIDTDATIKFSDLYDVGSIDCTFGGYAIRLAYMDGPPNLGFSNATAVSASNQTALGQQVVTAFLGVGNQGNTARASGALAAPDVSANYVPYICDEEPGRYEEGGEFCQKHAWAPQNYQGYVYGPTVTAATMLIEGDDNASC